MQRIAFSVRGYPIYGMHCDGNQKCLLIAYAHIGLRMRRQLRLATALRGKEAQRDHFTLTRAQAIARVVVAEAVAGKPLVDVSRIFGAGLRESTHSFTEDFDLLVFARPGTRFRRGGALRFKRKMHVGRAEEVVESLQERQGFAETTVCGRLIHHFLDGDGRQSGFVGHRQHHFESIQALASDQHGKNGQRAGFVIQIRMICSRFVHHFVISEIREEFNEFRIGL